MHLLQKIHTYQFQPYTWTHEFCVLADKDQCKVPTTSMKQELKEAGLAQKSIIFKNKKGNFNNLQEELYKNDPKLRESGGFEFYQQGSGKILSYIKYLKYSYAAIGSNNMCCDCI